MTEIFDEMYVLSGGWTEKVPSAILAVTDSMSGARGRSSTTLGDDGANGGDGFFGERAGLQRGEEFDALRGAEEFDGDGVAEIFEHAAEAAGSAHAHGDVVFLIAGSGNRIDGMWRGERFVFAGERGGGDLRDHEAGIEA